MKSKFNELFFVSVKTLIELNKMLKLKICFFPTASISTHSFNSSDWMPLIATGFAILLVIAVFKCFKIVKNGLNSVEMRRKHMFCASIFIDSPSSIFI